MQDRESTFAGLLLQVNRTDIDTTWYGSLLIQDEPETERQTGRVSVRIDPHTVMLGPSGELAAFEDLQVGDSVAVWTNKLILDSDPRQTYGDTLVITKTPVR